MTVPVLTVDGPSGSGKGTVSQILAARLGWHYLDSGALYRVIGLVAGEQGLPVSDGPAVAHLAETLDLRFEPQPDGRSARVWVAGRDVSTALRTEECGRLASQVAVLPELRRALLQKQHAFRRAPGLVTDGRDMGTTVFPGAVLKIFLIADPRVRAERRYKQLREKGLDVNLDSLIGEIRTRDERDAARAVSPLKPAADAEMLDTSYLSVDEVVGIIEGRLRRRLAEAGGAPTG